MVNGRNPNKKRGEALTPAHQGHVVPRPLAGGKPKDRRSTFAPHQIVHLRRFLRLSTERKNLEYPRLSAAAKRAGVDKKTIERWLDEYDISYFRLNGVRRVHWDSLQAFLEERARHASESE